jgi:hypothetical protein
MSRSTKERRAEVRYIVSGMTAAIDGAECEILDISVSAVRLVRPAGFQPDGRRYGVCFTINDGRGIATHAVTGRLIRTTELCVVLGYAAPVSYWENVLRSLDVFESNRLHTLAF